MASFIIKSEVTPRLFAAISVRDTVIVVPLKAETEGEARGESRSLANKHVGVVMNIIHREDVATLRDQLNALLKTPEQK